MLIGANYLVSALNKFLPDVDSATSIGEALSIIAVQIAVACGSLMLMTAVIVSAWRANSSFGKVDPAQERSTDD